MRKAPAEAMLDTPEAQRSSSVLGRVGRGMRNIGTGVTVAAGFLLGGDGASAQETVPAAPELVKKTEGKEKILPPTYDEAVKLTHKLGSSRYHTREETRMHMKDLFGNPDVGHRMMVWMAPEKDRHDLEMTKRIQEFEKLQIIKTLEGYPMNEYSDDWIDGTNYDSDGCHVRLPPMWEGAEFLKHHQITELYLGKASQRGFTGTGNPHWKQHGAALQILAEELRDHHGYEELWNAKARKEFDQWNLQNSRGDKGKWLLESFDERIKLRTMPKIEQMLEPYKRGSEKYRKSRNLPLKRPMGPMLRNGIIDPATIPLVRPEEKKIKKAG